MPDRIIERTAEGQPRALLCDCNRVLTLDPSMPPGSDIECQGCGREYNSAGQLLADRSQWGAETGETAADYYRGFNDPRHAFDGNDY